MQNIKKLLTKNNGYARMKYLRENGVQTRDIAKSVKEGVLEKIKESHNHNF
jgi:hypothetical protein